MNDARSEPDRPATVAADGAVRATQLVALNEVVRRPLATASGTGLHQPVSLLLRSSPREVGGRVLLDPAWEGVKVSSRQPSFERTEMPAPCNADTPSAQSFVQAGDVDAQLDGFDVYLTNEAFLYRVVGLVAGGMDEIVELEDCYGLDVVRVPMRDLSARRLRVVTPTPG